MLQLGKGLVFMAGTGAGFESIKSPGLSCVPVDAYLLYLSTASGHLCIKYTSGIVDYG